jgi:hypothetical protein
MKQELGSVVISQLLLCWLVCAFGNSANIIANICTTICTAALRIALLYEIPCTTNCTPL